MPAYKTPGVYVEEVPTLATSVAPLATAIPAFIGYTQNRPSATGIEAKRVNSFREFQQLFGGAFSESFSAEILEDTASGEYSVSSMPINPETPSYYLYHCLQMFYANGGGVCYVVSVGDYTSTPDIATLLQGLDALDREDEPTLIVIPDAISVVPSEGVTSYYSIYQQALVKSARLQDRFTIIDLHRGDQDIGLLSGVIQEFRDNIGSNNLSWGAAYYPWLLTSLGHTYDEYSVTISVSGRADTDIRLRYAIEDLDSLPDVLDGSGSPLPEDQKRTYYEDRSVYHFANSVYAEIKAAIDGYKMKLPPGAAIAGMYVRVDNERGVFKSPANEGLNSVIRPLINLDDSQLENMNVDSSGKSVNAIRNFSGKGTIVWGGRTLQGNSPEWRYISVRRFFLFVEESIKKALEFFVFESNSESTWLRLKGIIENFLESQWRAGALTGATAEQAFFVKVGLGETMSAQDVLEGRLILHIGLAAVRPAEFIILKFTHKLPEA